MDAKNELMGRGRLARGGFWGRQLVAVPVLLFVESAVANLAGRPYDLLPALALLAYLISTWVRRLHDRDRSGWWLLAVLVPIAGAVFLIVECAFRGTRPSAGRSGDRPDAPAPYLTVR